MITLITGLPGNGKTLYTLSFVKEYAEKEGRPVFYSGIKDLKLPWTEIDPAKWFDCPPGSIIVIDECQTLFRPRTIAKDVPEYVSKLEVHRHSGFDLFLITQHPMLADSALRRLCGRHFHVVRTAGMERATIHEWASVKDNCDKSAGRADSIKHFWKYDKAAYDFYHSAELHTVKRNIPKRVYILVAVPFLLVCAVYFVKYRLVDKHAPEPPVTQSQIAPLASVDGSKKGQFKYKEAIDDAKEYVFERTPRVEGLPHTSPVYDRLTEPTEVPMPAGCVQTTSGCKCYTQQATTMDVAESVCHDIVEHGYFEDFDRSANRRNNRPEYRPPAEVRDRVGSRVVVIDDAVKQSPASKKG